MKAQPHKRGSEQISACPLALEDWDFSNCEDGLRWYCFIYEYGRELPHLFKDSAGNNRFPHWFPETGFPEIPFLKSKHRAPLRPSPRFAEGPTVATGSLAYIRQCHVTGDQQQLLNHALLFVDWSAPDKTLTRDFGRWLKVHRRFPHKETRGSGSHRQFEAELKALGAARLLRHFSASEAMEFVEAAKGKGSTFYSKLSDWYQARKRFRNYCDYYFAGAEAGFLCEDSSTIPNVIDPQKSAF